MAANAGRAAIAHRAVLKASGVRPGVASALSRSPSKAATVTARTARRAHRATTAANAHRPGGNSAIVLLVPATAANVATGANARRASFDKALPAAGRRFGDDSRPARADKPRGPAPAARAERDTDDAPRIPRRDYEDAPGTLRLSKLMSELGMCSRREADVWIEKGWVLVDGERVDTLGTKVRPDQRIEIDPAAEAAQASQVTVLIHKTVGFVSGQAEDGYQPAITLVTPENRWEGDRSDIRFSVAHLRQLAPAGRLDIDSTGLLVLTQDAASPSN